MKGRLYISHLLTSWTDRVFEFACFLLIADIFKTSLLLASVYGFATTISAIVFSNYVGRYVDRSPRLSCVRGTLLVQKASIVISCGLFWLLLATNTYSKLFYFGVVICGCLLKLSFIANNIAIEKDWVMVIAESDTEAMLTVMKRIDLFCKTMAPVLIGSLMAFGPMTGVVIIAMWNIVSFLIEYQLCYQTYMAYPKLASKDKDYLRSVDEERTPLLDNDAQQGSATNMDEHQVEQHVMFMNYVRHPIFPASLTMALLYLTVLSFGGIMVTYLKIMGYTDWSLGFLRAFAGTMGILSTYLFPYLSAKVGVIRAGVWALWFECAMLAPVVLSMTSQYSGSMIGSFMLFGGMSLSRVGLWVFDIAETILLQQMVDPSQLGSISGWQHSLCNLFDLSQFILTAVVSDPYDFIIPSSISWIAVFCATLCYTYFVRKERGHLLHWRKKHH
jgi:iron-regulated transporter 1